uniref:Apolipoprotein A-IV n=1 Tax=Monopterus albus TaxID=43700 RepID=A0A3Q3JSP8_MONAL
MKVLVVLALAVFSVCNANLLWLDPPKSNLDMVTEAFWDYVGKMTDTAEGTVNQIRQSELGQEVNTRISQSAETVNQYIAAVRAQAAPLTQDFMTRFTEEAEQLKARLEKDLSAVGTNLQPYAEQLAAHLQTQVEELKKEAAPYAEAMDPETLKAILLQKSQELKEQVDKNMNDLEEFQRTMIPLAQSFETQLTQKTQEIQQNLTPYGEELKAKLDSSAQDLQAQLAALWESFTKKTQ